MIYKNIFDSGFSGLALVEFKSKPSVSFAGRIKTEPDLKLFVMLAEFESYLSN